MHRLSAICLFGAILLFAEDWQNATSLPGVDMGGLTPAQQTRALRVIRGQDCSCGCGMKIAECRVKDPTCAYSKGLAAVMVDAVKSGQERGRRLCRC